MASDTVPAVPDAPPRPAGTGPSDEAANPSGALGWLASAVAPIDPARSQFDLTPDAATPDTISDGPAASSTDFDIQPPPATDTTSGGGAKEGVWRTWLRAAAERWRRGGDIHVKRLEMLKAKAQAVQLKESRTVTVNRSPGITTKGGAGGGSGLGSKSNGSKNTPGSGAGVHNRSDAGSGSGRPATGPRPGNGGHRADRGQDAAGRGSAHRDRNASHDRRSPSKESAGKPSADTRSKSTKDTTSPRTSASGSGSQAGAKSPKSSRTTGGTDTATCGDSSSINSKRTPKEKNTAGGGSGPAVKDPKTGSGDTKQPANKPGKPGKPATPGTGKPVDLTKHGKTERTDRGKTTDGKDTTPAKPKGGTTPDTPTDKPSKAEKDSKKPVTGPDGTPIRTQPTREAGYRDGSRIATAVAHGQAYKDGVKDGYRDTKDATDREKNRLDTAHHNRRQQRPAPVPRTDKKEKPVQPTDYQAPLTEQAGPVRPLRAATVTGTHVVLDNGQPGTQPIPPMPLTPPAGSMQVCTRGEVRSLKSYERMLEAKVSVMTFTADSAKALEAHAHQQYLKAITLLEQAREIKGGEALLASLTRMAENTGVQAQQAAQLRKRAVRGVDATTSLLVNVKIRYGEVYQAICNSPLTTPAELDFYNDRSSTHA